MENGFILFSKVFASTLCTIKIIRYLCLVWGEALAALWQLFGNKVFRNLVSFLLIIPRLYNEFASSRCPNAKSSGKSRRYGRGTYPISDRPRRLVK